MKKPDADFMRKASRAAMIFIGFTVIYRFLPHPSLPGIPTFNFLLSIGRDAVLFLFFYTASSFAGQPGKESLPEPPLPEGPRKKSRMTGILIGILSFSAAVGIFVTLMAAGGRWDETTFRMLLSTLLLDACTLCFLSCHAYRRHGGNRVFTTLGRSSAALSFLWGFLLIWEIAEGDNVFKFFLILFFIVCAFAHSSLLLRVKPLKTAVSFIRGGTLFCIVLETLTLSRMVLDDFFDSEYLTEITVLGILLFLGSVLTPLLNRLPDQPRTASR